LQKYEEVRRKPNNFQVFSCGKISEVPNFPQPLLLFYDIPSDLHTCQFRLKLISLSENRNHSPYSPNCGEMPMYRAFDNGEVSPVTSS